MPNIGPTQMLIGLLIFIALIAAVFIGVKLATRSSKKS